MLRQSCTKSYLECLAYNWPKQIAPPVPVETPKASKLAELAAAQHELQELRADLARTLELQIEAEKGGKYAPAELLGSKAITQRRIEATERAMLEMHRKQAQANFRADEDELARATAAARLDGVGAAPSQSRNQVDQAQLHERRPVSRDAMQRSGDAALAVGLRPQAAWQNGHVCERIFASVLPRKDHQPKGASGRR